MNSHIYSSVTTPYNNDIRNMTNQIGYLSMMFLYANFIDR